MKKNAIMLIAGLLAISILGGCSNGNASTSQSTGSLAETTMQETETPEESISEGLVPDDAEDMGFNFETRTVTLNNGIEMPILGLGTFQLTPEQAEESVYHALQDGFRRIDTANMYMNERGVGRGIKRSGVDRSEIFITTKLWMNGYEDVETAIDETLERLDVEYIDLLLLHQPYGNYIEGCKAGSMVPILRQREHAGSV
ncbi:MAG: aldo/keto reductase [Clostridium sp.]|nr:aldo/keto reductase [Clostridium sp.]